MTRSTATITAARPIDRNIMLHIEPLSAVDLAATIALAASAALDGAEADETLAQRCGRYERALREIGSFADQAAQDHGQPPLRLVEEWEAADAPS